MRIDSSPIGELVVIRGHDAQFDEPYETHAYLPDPLPTTLDIQPATWMILTEAMGSLGRIDAAARLIKNPQLIVGLATRQEAIGTSALEGTFANLTDLYAAEIVPKEDLEREVSPSVREVMNYTDAANLAYQWVLDRPITIQLISTLQAEIVKGTPSDGLEAGKVRERQVFIGTRNQRIERARFVPPPSGDQLIAGYEQWVDWQTDEEAIRNIPLIARVAMAHYQFETLHPYTDGNGRVGRLLAMLQFLREGSLSSPVLSVSSWLTERSTEYRDHLLAVSRTGDWDPWIAFFAEAVRAEAEAAHSRVMRLLALRKEMTDSFRLLRPKARLSLEIVESLIEHPVLTVATSQEMHGRSNQANRNAIGELVEEGIIEPYSDARYDKMYWAPSVFRAIAG